MCSKVLTKISLLGGVLSYFGHSVMPHQWAPGSVIFVNENENGEKQENNEFVNKN